MLLLHYIDLLQLKLQVTDFMAYITLGHLSTEVIGLTF